VTWSADSGMRFSDIMAKKAKINPEISEILCPTCNKSDLTIFRRDRVSKEIYLNHCKCENCGQLFTYKVDKKNNPIKELENGI